MARLRSRCYIHSGKPPFQRIAGPIFASTISRRWGLSDPTSSRLTVAGDNIFEGWIRPGMVWFIDDSDYGEVPWAGFVAPQSVPLNADSLDINLIGPKKALLEIELAVKLPIYASKAYAVQRVIEAAQTRHGAIHPGIIDASSGAAIPMDVRGETISDFINTLTNETGNSEWRERVEIVSGGEELKFYLDFGTLKHPTNIRLGRSDLVDGLFIRSRVPTSLTLLGESFGFEERVAATVSSNPASLPAEPSPQTISITEIDSESLRDIISVGPGSQYHITQISERLSGDLQEVARQRHQELMDHVEEFILTVDMTRISPQKLRLGDVFHLDIPDWGKPLNRSVSVDLHLYLTEIDSERGERKLYCRTVQPEHLRTEQEEAAP